jgi:apolipoprotein N-acyltransferase
MARPDRTAAAEQAAGPVSTRPADHVAQDSTARPAVRRRGSGFVRAMTRPARYAALLAGALPVLAFPSLNLEFLAWFGLVPGLLLMRAAPTGREAAVRGWWLGAGYLLMAMYWLTPNIGPALLGVAIVLGLPWSGVGYAAWGLLRGTELRGQEPAAGRESRGVRLPGPPGPSARQALAAMVVIPGCWVVIDWIRSWQGIGGPWAVFGASQWQHPVVLALAATGGIWLVSFVLVAANTAIVIVLASARLSTRAIGAAGALLALAAGPVAFALTANEYRVPPTGHVTLNLVQPGLASGPHGLLNREISLTTAGPRADMVVWGESSVGYDLDTAHRVLHRLQRLSSLIGTQVLVSQDAVSPADAKSKVAVLIGPGGIEQSYTKTRLVPFGEYIPFRSALGWLTSISKAAPQNMISGNGARVLHAVLPDGRRLNVGVLICFESSFPDMSAVDARRGAQVLIYQTSDSTFEGSWAPEQHAALAALRAAETGRPAVQAALTGDSVAFDSRGRLLPQVGPSINSGRLAWADTADRGVLKIRLALPPASVQTPFDRFGNYVPWFCIAVLALAAAAALGTARRRERSASR